jgi:hypothetical protein
MRKILTAGAVAITCLASLGTMATTADAQTRGGGGVAHAGGGFHGGGFRGGGFRGGGYGWGVGAGLAGFALGAALAGPYGYGYPGYYYGPGYYDGYDGYYGAACVGTRRVWDPYYGGYVIRRFRYAC